jgi:hypothetical protein
VLYPARQAPLDFRLLGMAAAPNQHRPTVGSQDWEHNQGHNFGGFATVNRLRACRVNDGRAQRLAATNRREHFNKVPAEYCTTALPLRICAATATNSSPRQRQRRASNQSVASSP